MASKSNIRSMRFSDEMIEIIESQTGVTFTAKFEALVTRCIWELPRKQDELETIKMQISMEKEQLQDIRQKRILLESNIRDLNWTIENAQRQVKRINNALEKIET